MSVRGMRKRTLWTILLGVVIATIAPAGGQAAALHPTMLAKVGYGPVPPSFARTADGILHVAYETNISWGNAANGVGALSISPSGHVGPQVQALNWNNQGGSPNGIPGLAVLPSGQLEATFGGSPSGDDGPWGISSTDGGATWAAPLDIGSGSMEFGDSYVPLVVSSGAPVFAAGCCGGIVIQGGFGTGSPTYLLTNTTDNAAGNTDLAVDAATGAVIASWDSNAGSGGVWAQQVAPTQGTAQKAPIPTQYGTGEPLILAGRDTGPGVFAAYPADFGSTTHIRLLRYGGGSVAVGSESGLHAIVYGAATGNDGRIWVAWYGFINGKGTLAVTRSNKAVTRFEPLQKYHYDWAQLFTLNGDGRLGPLDLLMGGTPNSGVSGIYYSRILAELSATVSSTHLTGDKFKLTVVVTDAGDAVSGATVSAKGKNATTNATGKATLTVTGSPGDDVTVTITHPAYKALKESATL